MTFGGPIKKDRIHYFVNYEYERSPYTRPYTTPYPAFNINLQGTYTEKKGGGRLDVQFSPKTHFTYRQNLQRSWDPYDARWAGGSIDPSLVAELRAEDRQRHHGPAHARPERVGGQRGRLQLGPLLVADKPGRELAESSAGVGGLHARHAAHPAPRLHDRPGAHAVAAGSHRRRTELPRRPDVLVRPGRTARREDGRRIHSQQLADLPVHQLRRHARRAGRHRSRATSSRCSPSTTTSRRGTSTAIAAGAHRVRFYQLAVGDFHVDSPIRSFATWMQDDWTRGRLTLNLGVRYDYIDGTWAEDLPFDQWVPVRAVDKNNIQPRLGFAYSLNDRTVAARRLGTLRGRRDQFVARVPRGRAGGEHPGQLRRSSGLPDEPVQRADPDLRAGGRHRDAAVAVPDAAVDQFEPAVHATRPTSACSGSSGQRCRWRPTSSTRRTRTSSASWT